jgi:hypothetical protein
MAELFTKKLEDAIRRNDLKYGSEELRDFMRDKALQSISRNVNPRRLIDKKKASTVSIPTPGEMVCYFYDAKWKDKLPYWDKFPMIFCVEIYSNGWLGINLHYLPPIYRARAMDMLYELLNNKSYDETTRLRLTYQVLKNLSKFNYFKPTIKRYLTSHVQSRIVKIDPTEWDFAMFLPTARFQKARDRKVWDDSISKIMRG